MAFKEEAQYWCGFETGLEDESNNNVKLLGMPRENDWVLYGPYADKSLLRNVLIFQLANEMGRYAPRTDETFQEEIEYLTDSPSLAIIGVYIWSSSMIIG